MPFINPYIEKVENHKDISIHQKEIFEKKGKWSHFFKNNNPIHLEIGTGLGNFFSNECSSHPDINYIGMEIKYKRCYTTAQKSIEKGAKNFHILKEYGQNIDKIFQDGEVDQVYIFFPDPWGRKDRQKKHRIFQKEFLEKLYAILKTNGKIIFKTDHKEYFDDTIQLIDEMNIWKKENQTYDYERELELFDKTNITEFEQIFRGEKLKICYVELKK